MNSSFITFYSLDYGIAVINMALNIFISDPDRRKGNLTFNQSVLLSSIWISALKDEIANIQHNHPSAIIGIDMEFIRACENSGAFVHFSTHFLNKSNVLFYHLEEGSLLYDRIVSDLNATGCPPCLEYGALFLGKPPIGTEQSLIDKCEAIVHEQLVNIVRDIVTVRQQRELLASSNLYVDHYVDIKGLFLKPRELDITIFYLIKLLLSKNYNYDALVSTSKNGSMLASLIGQLIGKEVIHCINVGPRYSLSRQAVERAFQPEKRYVYIFDFICIGTEAKTLHALIDSRSAVLVGGVGIASLVPLDNEDLAKINSPLASLSCLVNLPSEKIPYHIFLQKNDF